MGESVLEKTGLNFEVILPCAGENNSRRYKERRLKMLGAGCDMILFSGGDGTASDVIWLLYENSILGIPSGVKIFSPVFALPKRMRKNSIDIY